MTNVHAKYEDCGSKESQVIWRTSFCLVKAPADKEKPRTGRRTSWFQYIPPYNFVVPGYKNKNKQNKYSCWESFMTFSHIQVENCRSVKAKNLHMLNNIPVKFMTKGQTLFVWQKLNRIYIPHQAITNTTTGDIRLYSHISHGIIKQEYSLYMIKIKGNNSGHNTVLNINYLDMLMICKLSFCINGSHKVLLKLIQQLLRNSNIALYAYYITNQAP
jgi:hypothetical protein